MDTKLLKDTFALVAPRADELVEFFYADVFYRGGPEVAEMFPPLMTAQRDRLVAALATIVADVDDLDRLSEYLTGLGRDHRKFGVTPEHYEVVGQALLTTLRHFAGDAWTPEVAETWAAAYALIAQVMIAGARSADGTPPWWPGTILHREMRGTDIAVIRIRLDAPMEIAPGQSVAVQFPAKAPGVWRFYSPANVADTTGLLTFHVKVEDGGLLSTALGLSAETGDRVRLGPPLGSLNIDPGSDRDVLLIAGSTGLAPLMAILAALAARDRPPAVDLFFGARDPDGLYELPALEKMAGQNEWLTLVHAVSAAPEDTPGYEGAHGNIVDIMGRGSWEDRDAYVCGSSPMVAAAQGRLIALGVPEEQIHTEDFGWVG